ncbi:MAG: NUDIX domain-containing protein, partial [Methanoregulaceae archaeon]|nr:NUDIX domain-containing protein [Methanoregulaceae archaeon]
YSVLAGFLEPYENFEDCVHREVKEEVGIDVTNIRYFGSEQWPFPDSLMVGMVWPEQSSNPPITDEYLKSTY